MSQTMRNLTIELLNLIFVSTTKLTLLHSFYTKKVFISCVLLIAVSRVHTTSKLFDTDILQHSLLDLLFQTDSRRYFQLVENKKYFAWENAKEEVEGLETGPGSCRCRKFLARKSFNNVGFDTTYKGSEKTFNVSRCWPT